MKKYQRVFVLKCSSLFILTMTEGKEQHVSEIIFCWKHDKCQVKQLSCLKQLTKKLPWARLVYEMVAGSSKTNLIHGYCQPPEQMDEKNHKNSWTPLGRPLPINGQSWWFVWCVLELMLMNFENCKLNELQENLCPTCSWKIKNSHEWMHVMNWNNSWSWSISFYEGYQCWQKLVL